MNFSIKRILELRFLPIIDFDSIKNLNALIEIMLEQDVSVLQMNFKNQEQIQYSYHIAELFRQYPEMSIGAGFLYSKEDAEIAIKNGANFIVSSFLAKELFDTASWHNIPAIISGFTPTEIYEAQKTNAELIQIFPASQLHQKSIVSIIEHMPAANFLLTGGLTLSSSLDFLRCGVKAVGVKGIIFQKEHLQEENYQAIANSIKNFKNRVQQV